MKNTLSILTILLLTLTQCKKDYLKFDRCNLNADAGFCIVAIPKYYYEKNEKKCKQFTWGCCGGLVTSDTM